MSGYEQRLAADKAEIRNRVVAVGNAVERAIGAAVEALLTRDRQGSSHTALGDLPINREIRAINKLCHAFVARHLPSAGHLRFVSSVLQMNVALERIGDYAVTISREAVQLSTRPSETLSRDMRSFADQARLILREALLAFSEKDAQLARKTAPRASSAERTFAQIYRELTHEEGAGIPLADAFALLTVFHRLERVADQAKNISEETLFELTGETKPAKRYEILFVDDDGTTLAPLAEALARRAFPQSGSYTSAALAQPEAHSEALLGVAAESSLDLSDVRVEPLSTDPRDLERHHVIVALTPNVAPRISKLPYATALLEWIPETLPTGFNRSSQELTPVSQWLSVQIRDLMVLMRGEDAH